MNAPVLFLQKRPHRGGAQTCLARLLRVFKPALLCCAETGWLTEASRRADVPVILENFPSPRTLGARLFGNQLFARRLAKHFAGATPKPALVHANDYQESLLALELARQLNVPSAVFLRSIAMSERDYLKHRCPEHPLIFAVGEELHARVRSWLPHPNLHLIHDGLAAEEFARPKPASAQFPSRILVIGSPLVLKGWADFTAAVWHLENTHGLAGCEFHFTGAKPQAAANDLQLGRLAKNSCKFLGRVEQFRDLVLQYDLVINPSRMESFGMAAVEVLAAGVPLLSSRAGVAPRLISQPEWLFDPGDPQDLARALQHLRAHWPEIKSAVPNAQAKIREHYLVEHSLQTLRQGYATLPALNAA